MVNCCIVRKLQNAPQNGNTKNYDLKPLKRPGDLFDDIPINRTLKAQSLLEKFVEGNRSGSTIDVSLSFFGYKKYPSTTI